MITENLPILKINKLSQKQYDRESVAGNLNENEIYLTPDTSLTVWQPNTEYKVGDVVIANVYEQESKSTITSICYCIQNHKSSSGDFLLFEYEGDKWIRDSVRAVYDAYDNFIHLHYATNEYVDAEIKGVNSKINTLTSSALIRKIVENLPSENIETNVIYMIPSQNSVDNNIYDEYMFFTDPNNGMLMPEIIGSTAVDLSGYLPLSGGTIEGSLLLIDEEGYVQGHIDASGATFYAPGFSSSFTAGSLQIAAGGEYILIGTNSVDGSDNAKAAWQQWLEVGGGTDLSNYYTKLETEEYIDAKIGDIETALDNIIAIQNQLIGGEV